MRFGSVRLDDCSTLVRRDRIAKPILARTFVAEQHPALIVVAQREPKHLFRVCYGARCAEELAFETCFFGRHGSCAIFCASERERWFSFAIFARSSYSIFSRRTPYPQEIFFLTGPASVVTVSVFLSSV